MSDGASLDAMPDENFRGGDPAVAATEELARRHGELVALYTSHCVKVAGYFRAAGIHDALARELAQDTFMLAFRGLPKFKRDAKMSTWLWAIATNVLATQRRSAKPHDLASAEEPLDPDVLTAERDGRLTDCQDCVRRGLAAFSADHPDRAQAVYLAVVLEYSTQELAEELGRTPHAAAEYLSQCKARLRPYIKNCHEP